ncbi:molybdopterin-dependent oxidoreductase [Spiribacter curvatus]|nr:molybdopterin-dependent oxidoreductase [Spiribacter curvatus]
MNNDWRAMAIALALILLSLGSGAAGALEPPTGTPILTVSGDIGVTNQGDQAVFDYEMLESLGTHTTRTSTPWHDGTQTFTGPLIRSLLDTVDAEGERIIAKALNDYESEIPIEDFTTYDVILATHQNGERMSVRDRGPIFVIYPFDSDPALYQETIISRSVWQVNRIQVP